MGESYAVWAIGMTVFGVVAVVWLWRRDQADAASLRARPPRYLLLYVRDGDVRAADATPLVGQRGFPDWLRCGETEYRRLQDEETFFFWDDLVNADGATVGYVLNFPPSATFNASRFVTESQNVAVDEHGCLWLALLPSLPLEEACVQGFGSEVYYSTRDSRDCVLLMFDFSENQIAFKLHSDAAWTSSHRATPLREIP